MKNITTLAVAAVLGLALCSSAIAQGRPGGARGQRPPNAQPPAGAPQHPTDAAPAVGHLTEAFAKVAPFDANKDGQLDATEKESLAKAMVEGTVQAPAHRTPPAGVKPTAEMILNRIAGMYALVAPYDANHDGALNDSEKSVLKAAIESGELPRPGGPRGQRPPGAGGPGGRPGQQ